MSRFFRNNGLSLVLFVLFFFTLIIGQSIVGQREYNNDQLEHGKASEQVSALTYMGTSRFWFESLQNWQSEFLAIGLMVLLTVWLRQKGSPESKPVDAPHDQTGE
jgi:hypothetical protein